MADQFNDLTVKNLKPGAREYVYQEKGGFPIPEARREYLNELRDNALSK